MRKEKGKSTGYAHEIAKWRAPLLIVCVLSIGTNELWCQDSTRVQLWPILNMMFQNIQVL